MAEVEIQPKVLFRSIIDVTASAGPVPPAGTAIIELDGPHGLTDDDGVWVSDVGGISGINELLEQPITVIDATTVSLDDATAISGTYTGGGVFRDARQYVHREPNGFRKPLNIGGALYYALSYIPSSERVTNLGETSGTRMYKSTDNGATWVRMDAAGEVAEGTENLAVYLDGTTIWAAYTGGSFFDGSRSWTTLFVIPFDTLTDTWGTSSPQGPFGNPPGSNSFPIVMADGRVLLFHEYAELQPGSSSTDSRRPAWSVYNPASGLWDSVNNFWSFPNNTVSNVVAGSPPTVTTLTPHNYLTGIQVTIAGVGGVTNVNGTRTITVTGPTTFTLNGASSSGTYTGGGTTYVPAGGSGAVRASGCVLGDGGRAHFFYGINRVDFTPSAGYLLHRSFDTSTLTLTGTEQVLTGNTTSRFLGCGVPLVYERGGSKQLFIVVTYQDSGSGVSKLQAIEAASALNPSWVTSDVTTRADLINAPDASWADAAYDPLLDKLWLFFNYIAGQYPVTLNERYGIAYKSKTPGGLWDSDTTWKANSTFSYAVPSVAVIGAEVRVIYTKIRPEDLPTDVSVGFLAELFPHIDVVSVCPPGVAANYAFFY